MVVHMDMVMVVPDDESQHAHQWYVPNRAFAVFSLPLWTTILWVFGLLVVTHLTMTKHNPNRERLNSSTNSAKRMPSLWRWFAYYMQGNLYGALEHNSIGLKLIMLVTGLFTVHTLCLYQGYLLTQLVRDMPDPLPFSSIKDVATLIEHKAAILNMNSPDFIMAQHLANYNSSPYEGIRQLGQALRLNPPIFGSLHGPRLRQLQQQGVQVVIIKNALQVIK